MFSDSLNLGHSINSLLCLGFKVRFKNCFMKLTIRRFKWQTSFMDSPITPGFVSAIGSIFLVSCHCVCLRLSFAVETSRLKHMLMDAH